MWVIHTSSSTHDNAPLSHDRPCQQCGHAGHLYLACDVDCGCVPLAAQDALRFSA